MITSYNDWYPIIMTERESGKNAFLKELKCEHYDGEKCTLFPKCVFPDCRYYVTVEEC